MDVPSTIMILRVTELVSTRREEECSQFKLQRPGELTSYTEILYNLRRTD